MTISSDIHVGKCWDIPLVFWKNSSMEMNCVIILILLIRSPNSNIFISCSYNMRGNAIFRARSRGYPCAFIPPEPASQYRLSHDHKYQEKVDGGYVLVMYCSWNAVYLVMPCQLNDRLIPICNRHASLAPAPASPITDQIASYASARASGLVAPRAAALSAAEQKSCLGVGYTYKSSPSVVSHLILGRMRVLPFSFP